MSELLNPLVTRRRFIRDASLALCAAGAFPSTLLAGERGLRANPIRLRGSVRAAGKGIGGVAVSDGVSVTTTRPDGTYELVSTARRPFAFITVPSGYQLPVNPTGTALFYKPIQKDREDQEVDFSLEKAHASDSRHAFLVLADPQMENSYETGLFLANTVPDVRRTVGTLAGVPVFGVACGDIAFDHPEVYPDYQKGVAQMEIPFFQVLGNHDMSYDARTDELSTREFSRLFGPPYYSFNRGAVHYVVLDDVMWHGKGYIGYLDETQLTWLEQDLALVEPGSTVVVFGHIPTRSTQEERAGGQPHISNSITNREVLYRILEPYRAHFIAGHTHEKDHLTVGKLMEHVSGAACGAWWSGPICYDGAPNGYDVFEINGEAVTWRYKGTGEAIDFQVRTYAPGVDPANPGRLVANVWDWDSAWKVVWFEGSDRKGEMTRFKGLDPLSVKLHAGPELPKRREWVDPIPTEHLFYADPANGAAITVEATDRFGRVYTARVTA